MALGIAGLKLIGSVGAATAVVGGGGSAAYFYYKDSKSTGTTSTSTVKPVTFTTNLFVGRVKETPTSEENISQPVKCKIDATKTVDCTIHKFTTPKTTNKLEKFKFSTLSKVTATKTDLTANTFVVVELMNEKLSFEQLKNKTIAINKTDETTKIVDLELDQLLKAKSVDTLVADSDLDVLEAKLDTYLVEAKTITTSATVDPVNYRCKLAAATSKLANFDDSCKLFALPTVTSPNTLATFTEVKNASTAVTKEALTTSSVGKYFKLVVDSDKLYNLTFGGTTEPELTVEIIPNTSVDSTTSVGVFTLKQKLSDNAFVGKTNLALAKVTVTKTEGDGAASPSQCNFTKTSTTTGQLPCSLHVATEAASQTGVLNKLTLTDTAITDASADFTVNKYFLIKLTTAQDISTLTKGKKIYYQLTKTANPAKHDSVELEIVDLLSGEFAASKKPFFITNYSATTA